MRAVHDNAARIFFWSTANAAIATGDGAVPKRVVVFAANAGFKCRHFQAQLVRIGKYMKHNIFFNKERETS